MGNIWLLTSGCSWSQVQSPYIQSGLYIMQESTLHFFTCFGAWDVPLKQIRSYLSGFFLVCGKNRDAKLIEYCNYCTAALEKLSRIPVVGVARHQLPLHSRALNAKYLESHRAHAEFGSELSAVAKRWSVLRMAAGLQGVGWGGYSYLEGKHEQCTKGACVARILDLEGWAGCWGSFSTWALKGFSA